MPPTPKHPSVRQRRNQVATTTTLQVVPAGEREVPELPERFRRVKDPDGGYLTVPAEWHPMAAATWTEVWSSPMVAEYLEADHGGIRILLALESDFWERLEAGRSVTELAAEISRIRKNFGLAPMGRRSLQWTIAQTQETMDRNRRRRVRAAEAIEGSAEELPSTTDAEVVDVLEALE